LVFIHRKDEKMKKHSLILFLLIISVLTVIFTFSAYAEALDSGVCGETLTYLLDDTGTLTVSGSGNMYDYDYSNYAPWYQYCDFIRNIVISDGVTSIGDYSFYGCEKLTGVNIPDGVTNIGSHAFGDCVSLENITIPASVKSIGNATFSGCIFLMSVTFGNDAQLEKIGESAFNVCSSLMSIVVPKNVASIGRYAFSGCNSLESVIFSEGSRLSSIGEYAFQSCVRLKSITIPSTVINIGYNVFYLADSLEIHCSYYSYAYTYAQRNNIPCVINDNIDNYIVARGFCGDDIDWVLDSEGTLTLSGTGAMWDFYSGTQRPWEKYYDSIKNIIIENGITTIGVFGFYGCNKAETISIPDSLESIGSFAIMYCISLTKITVGSNNKVFSSDESGVLFNKDKTELIQYPAANPATTYRIPSTVTYMAQRSFKCDKLINLIIPDSVVEVEDDAFGYDVYPSNIYYMGSEDQWGAIDINASDSRYKYAWEKAKKYFDCSRVYTVSYDTVGGGQMPEQIKIHDTSLTLSGTIPQRKGYVFLGWATSEYGEAMYQPGDIYSVNEPMSLYAVWAWECGSKAYATLRDGTLTISGTGAMWNWNMYYANSTYSAPWYRDRFSIKKIIIDDGITSIGDYAFLNCTKVTSVEFDETSQITRIGNYAFSFCKSLLEITIPKNTATIGVEAFENCESLKSITITESVTMVYEKAFYCCEKLADVTFTNGSAMVIGKEAFSNCESLESIIIPSRVTAIREKAFYCCKQLTEVAFTNDSVAAISNEAFGNCDALKNIDMPDSITKIGCNAFINTAYFNDDSNWENDILYIDNHLISAKTSLEGICTIKPGVKNIADNAFENCSKINRIVIPDGISTIGCNAFSGCNALKSITIPEGITTIPDFAFYKCKSMMNITVSGSVQNIGTSAFSGCSKLTDIYYTQSEEEWVNISINTDNDSFISAEIHYNYIPSNVIYGDIQGDGEISVSDVITLLRLVASNEAEKLNDNQRLSADVNGDGNADVSDAIRILQHIANPESVPLDPHN